MPDSPAPLILTLALDAAAQTYFNALRRRHFPLALNYLAAHLTLFHHLPGTEPAAVAEQLRACCRGLHPLPLRVTGLRSLGRGVAFTLENAELPALHRQLSRFRHPPHAARPAKAATTCHHPQQGRPRRGPAAAGRAPNQFCVLWGRGHGPAPVGLPQRPLGKPDRAALWRLATDPPASAGAQLSRADAARCPTTCARPVRPRTR